MDGETIIWVVAVVASVLGLGSLGHFSYIATYWPVANGRVVGNSASYAHHDAGSSTVYFAKITFTAHDGFDYTILSDVGRQRPWTVGDVVKVHYNKDKPMHAMTMKWWERLVFSGAFIGFAVLSWLAAFEVIR